MSRTPRQSVAELEKKKYAIGGVIDFNGKYGIAYSKIQLFKHFGISVATGYNWFPPASAAKNRTGRPKAGTVKDEHESPRLKRAHSDDPDDMTSPIKADPDQTPVPPRQNPVRNGGRDRKRLKAVIEGLAENESPPSTPPISPPSTAHVSSPPPPEQLLTPPKGNRARPKKDSASISDYQKEPEERVMNLEHDEMDDDYFILV